MHVAPENAARLDEVLALLAMPALGRYLLPAVFPSFVTGAITASGGSWNASIVAIHGRRFTLRSICCR